MLEILSFGPEAFEHSVEDVPSCESTLSAFAAHKPSARASNGSSCVILEGKLASPEAVFKADVLEIAQTLKLSGWDKLPRKRSSTIHIEKLSGATTNAVYVVSPPITQIQVESAKASDEDCLPRKVLLRIYGAQTGCLIDRGAEINVLGRLAKKRLAPRVLGTFTNGRFEEYFSARPLTIAEMCEPTTSLQIAEQLRELHDGFPLLEKERHAGPFIWCIWEKWVERCEEVCTTLDREILRGSSTREEGRGSNWRERGLVCGTEWRVFRGMVDRYRAFLVEKYNGPAGTKNHLVFAHNDVKYDNILRLEPAEESLLAQRSNPLLLIDFEYSGANTEWCYDYNDKVDPTAFREKLYPTVTEQRRFVRGYVDHTRGVTMHNSSSSSQLQGFQDHEKSAEHERQIEEEVDRLLEEATLWRAATSVLWVAWAIVQANLDKELIEPAMCEDDDPDSTPVHDHQKLRKGSMDPSSKTCSEPKRKASETAPFMRASKGIPNGITAEKMVNGEHSKQEEDEFDYLGCAQDRVLVFWGDIVNLGIISAAELPERVQRRIKICDDKRRGSDRENTSKGGEML